MNSCVVLLSIGEGLAFPVTTTLLNDLAPASLRGRVNALISVSISGGTMAGPLIAGAALPWGRGIPFLLGLIAACAVIALLGAAMRGSGSAGADEAGPAAAPAAAEELVG